MKLFTAFCAAVLLSASAAYSQWTFVKAFPDTNFKGQLGCHGLATDPEGKIWIQRFNASDSIVVDPVTGRKRATRVVYVFKPDGSPASFSPIKTVTVGGVTDTLYNSSRGLRADHEGNILVSSFDTIYRINYKTGQGMNKVIPQINPSGTQGSSETLTAAAVDAQGNMFTAQVFPGWPIRIFDKDFNLIGNAVDSSVNFSRAFEVSADGNTIYWAGYPNHAIYKYTRADEFSEFAVTDTVLKGFDAESFAWNPGTGYLWVSAGSGTDRPNRFPGATTLWSFNTWYAYDTANNQVVDSLKWVFQLAGADERPRAIDFSVTGDTAYVACFNNSTYPPVQMFVKGPVSVAERPANIPEGYTLSQNFPNPFNPTTEIQFSIAKAGVTTLKIYDMLGKEVATLVNKHLPAGTHKFTFDASRLATGAYIYEMRSNGVRLSRKMSFMK